MNITMVEASMTHSKESGYVGRVIFQAAEHPYPYEITLYSKDRKSWSYSLNFAQESGSEEDITAVEELLEEDDDVFDALIEAAESKLVK